MTTHKTSFFTQSFRALTLGALLLAPVAAMAAPEAEPPEEGGSAVRYERKSGKVQLTAA